MRTQVKQSIFVVAMLTVATLLVVLSLLTDREATPILTYSEDDAYFLNEWKEAGGGDFASWGFPESVLKQFDITARSFAPEVFFSSEFQSALFASREPFSIAGDPNEYLHRYKGTRLGVGEFNFSVENERRKMAAISRLRNPDDLPPHVLEGLELQRDQFNRLREDLMAEQRELRESSMFATLPVDQVFERLHPMDQRTLEPYRERLTDFFAIQLTVQEMSDSEREAAFRLLALMRKPYEEPVRYPPDVEEKLRLDIERGYRIVPDELANTTLLKQQIESRSSGTSPLPFTRDSDRQVAFHLDSAEAHSLVQNLSPVPKAYILPQSENFVVRFSNRSTWKRYYSKTVFGGAVAIDETETTDVHYPFSNLTVAGRDAVIMHQLHKSHHWVTRVSAFNGKNRFTFTADGKLEGSQREAFIEFCRVIAESSL